MMVKNTTWISTLDAKLKEGSRKMLNEKIESDKRSRVIVSADVRIIKIRIRLEVSKTVVLLTILKSQC